MKPEELERLRETATRVGREAGYELVVLFGSATREEEERAPEDLDLALRGDGPLDLVDATNRFVRALGTPTVDVVDLRRADPLLMMLVARDGVVLHEAEPGLFAAESVAPVRLQAEVRHRGQVLEVRGDPLQLSADERGVQLGHGVSPVRSTNSCTRSRSASRNLRVSA